MEIVDNPKKESGIKYVPGYIILWNKTRRLSVF